MRSLLLRFGVIGACFAIALAIAGGCATKSSLPPVSAATTSWTPVPCVSPGQTGPSCQPTYPGYQYVPPGSTPTPVGAPTLSAYSGCLTAGCAQTGPRVAVGPQASVTCAPSSTNFTTSTPISTIESDIQGGAAGSAYCFAAGTYSNLEVQYMPTNSIIIGLNGAILDGGGTTAFAFIDNGGATTGVTIKNFTIQNYAPAANQGAIQISRSNSTGYTIANNNFLNSAATGLIVNAQANIVGNYFYNNQQAGVEVEGSTGTNFTDNILYDNNSNQTTYPNGSSGGGGGKFFETTNSNASYNYTYGNLGPGLWFDTNNTGSILTYNDSEGNYRNGLIYEISYDGVLQHNYLAGNGLYSTVSGLGCDAGDPYCAAIFLSTSGGETGTIIDISSNTIFAQTGYGSAIGIINASRGSGTYGTYQAQNIKVHNNNINMNAVNSITGGVDQTGSYPNMFVIANSGILFDYDAYVANSASSVWEWGAGTSGVFNTFSGFQGYGQELHGTVAAPSVPVLTPNFGSFAGANPPVVNSTITEGNYTGPWLATPPPSNLVTVNITGNMLTVGSNNNGAGSGTVTVSDSYGNTAPFNFTVATPPPTAGPVIISPTSLSFASTGSSAQNITVTESNYTGAFTGACNPSGIVTVGTFSGGVSSVSPVAAGNCTLTVTGGNTASIQVSVSPAPTLPTPNLAIATPFGGYSGPTPTQTTFPQLSALTIGAVVKCTTDSTGNAIAGFAGAYEFRAGTCDGSTNPVSNVGLQFYDTGNAQGVWPANSLTSGATQAVIAVRDGTTINVYVCPSTASPAYTCGSPTTFTNSGTIATGTEPGYIGAGSNGTAELMTGDIWNFWLGPNLNATQVQQLAYQIGAPDPYPTPPPGPLSAAPALLALPAPTATATSIITDPGCGGCTFSVSPVPVGVVSASIASGVVTITGNGTLCASNCSVNVSDGGYNTLAIPVTVSPTPVTVPAPVFTATAPGTTYPITETLPMTPSITVTAVIRCLATANNGAAIISGAGNFSMSAGLCNGSGQTNPTNGTGMHFYDSTGSGAQAPSTSTSSNSLNTGSKYYIAGNVDAVNHLTNFYYCVLPYTLNNCVQYQSSDTTSAFPTGNITGYIGAASDGTSRNATSFLHIWDVGLYNLVLSPQQVNAAAAAAPSGDPYPTPTPTAGGVGNYAFVANPREGSPQNTYVFAAHPGTSPTPIGIVGQLVGSTVAAHILSGPGSAANVNYYNYASSHGSGYIYGWDNNSIYASPTRPGEGPWSATTSDPVWQIYAIDSCKGGSSYGCTANSTVPLGPASGACGYSGNCGYANGITNVYIPYGATPENYGSGQCDCHLFVTQPYGWVPTFRTGSPGASKTWPDVSGGGKMPFYYTVELENAFKQYTCTNASTAACAQYEPGGTLSSPSTLWTSGIIAISTAQGFYNASQNNYGFPSASMCSAAGINASFCTPPGTGFYGGGTHGSTPFMAQMISSTDATNGHINHQIGIGMVCLNASASNVWPGPTTQTDHPGETDCSVISGGSSTVGYTYDGHGTLLEPNGSGGYRLATMADICTVSSGSWAIGKTCTSGDALGGSLTIGTTTYTWPRFDATSSGAGANVYGPLMTAEALINYGATFVDTAGTYGPTYAGRINGGDAGWNAAASAWGLSLSGGSYTVKFGLPYQYMASHFAEFDSCAVPGNPNSC